MKYTGNLLKMSTKVDEGVEYSLKIGEDIININSLLGKNISINFLNTINCIACGKRTKTSFSQGFCYKCYQTLPQTDSGVLRPETDFSHLGISRDMNWSEKHSLIPHIVYLAYSGNVKIGVTRHNQIPTRWIDQGASSAIILAETPNRHIAGAIEVYMKKYFSDKTKWQEMLKLGNTCCQMLESEKLKASRLLHNELKQYISQDNTVYRFNYPLENTPEKLKSKNLDKEKEISGILTGVKGQYLILDNEIVVNIRRHSGYLIELTIN
ncbi:MAG: DUF2797 domain-containing protein [Marinifilaceae bacterium]|jgi:hypothetical protein|nr:DUF2797 domain-containing protein [Marinifilaceae bacterium]